MDGTFISKKYKPDLQYVCILSFKYSAVNDDLP